MCDNEDTVKRGGLSHITSLNDLDILVGKTLSRVDPVYESTSGLSEDEFFMCQDTGAEGVIFVTDEGEKYALHNYYCEGGTKFNGFPDDAKNLVNEKIISVKAERKVYKAEYYGSYLEDHEYDAVHCYVEYLFSLTTNKRTVVFDFIDGVEEGSFTTYARLSKVEPGQINGRDVYKIIFS